MTFFAAATGETGWLTITVSTVTAIVTILTSFLFSRKKQRTDDFAAFMEESADFREEIRKELKRKQEEYDHEIEKYKMLISKKETELLQLRKDNEDYIVHYKFISDFMPQFLWTAAPNGDVNYYNGRWYEYTGLPFDESKDWGWMSVVHPDDVKHARANWEEALRRSTPLESALRLRRGSDGTYHKFLCRAIPRFDSNGRVIQWVGTCTDINDFILP